MSTQSIMRSVIDLQRSQRVLLIITWCVSTITSFMGLRVIMPGEGLWRDCSAAMIAIGGVFCCLYILWTNQQKIFAELDPTGRSQLAIVSHVATVLLVLMLSTPSSYIAMVWEDASEMDMANAKVLAEEYANQASSANEAAAGIAQYINTLADEMDQNAESARNGEMTGVGGEGPIYLRYRQMARQLRSTSALIFRSREEAESINQRADISLRQMRKAIDSDLPLDQKVSDFEAAYRDFSQHYVRLSNIDLKELVETDLSRLTYSKVLLETRVKNGKKAMDLVNAEARRLVGQISEHIQTKAIKIRPLPAYALSSPSIVSFKYCLDYWVQLGLAAATDLTSLLTIWLLMAARHQARNYGDHDKLYSPNEIALLGRSLDSILKARESAKEEIDQ